MAFNTVESPKTDFPSSKSGLTLVELSTHRTRGRFVRCTVHCNNEYRTQPTEDFQLIIWQISYWFAKLTNQRPPKSSCSSFLLLGPYLRIENRLLRGSFVQRTISSSKNFQPFFKIKREIILKTEEKMKVSPLDNQGSKGPKGGMSFEKETTNRNKKSAVCSIINRKSPIKNERLFFIDRNPIIDLWIHWSLLDGSFFERIKYFESLYLQQKPSAIKIKKSAWQ